MLVCKSTEPANNLWELMRQHDTGLITAFRSYVRVKATGAKLEVSRKQNLKRNSQLKAELTKKYNITVVQGKHIEDYGTPEAQEKRGGYFLCR